MKTNFIIKLNFINENIKYLTEYNEINLRIFIFIKGKILF